MSVALYYLGPIAWPGRNEPWVAILVLTGLLAFNIGYSAHRPHRNPLIKRLAGMRAYWSMKLLPRPVAVAFITGFLVLSVLLIQVTTGKNVLSPSSWSLSQGDVYSAYQEHISYGGILDAAGISLLLLRSILFPVALVSFCLYFRKSNYIVAIFLVGIVLLSLFRGTDKEIADASIILLTAIFYTGFGRRMVAYAVPVAMVVLFIFIERKAARYGTSLPLCLADVPVCFNYDSILARVSDKLEFGVVMLTGYLTNGYEGLSIAVRQGFEFNYGVGHLPAFKSIVCNISDRVCDASTYNERLPNVGWDTRYRWTTAYTNLADDLSFYMVPVFMFVLGVVFRRAEYCWIAARDPLSLAAIVMVSIFFAYAPANMQIGLTLEWSLAWIVIIYGVFLFPPLMRRFK